MILLLGNEELGLSIEDIVQEGNFSYHSNRGKLLIRPLHKNYTNFGLHKSYPGMWVALMVVLVLVYV